MTFSQFSSRCSAKRWKQYTAEIASEDYRDFVYREIRTAIEEMDGGGFSNVRWVMPSLEKYASDYTMRGEKIVAAETVYRLNDKYFGQCNLIIRVYA